MEQPEDLNSLALVLCYPNQKVEGVLLDEKVHYHYLLLKLLQEKSPFWSASLKEYPITWNYLEVTKKLNQEGVSVFYQKPAEEEDEENLWVGYLAEDYADNPTLQKYFETKSLTGPEFYLYRYQRATDFYESILKNYSESTEEYLRRANVLSR